ncbi:SDR family oxidoreductase [soil metagenome]
MKHRDRVAIVTGAAHGIGLACAKRLAADGAIVVLSDIDEAEGAVATKAIGDSAIFVRCDVGNAAEVNALVARAVEKFGAVDILINNAGIVSGADFLDLTEEIFDRVLRINLKGAFLVGQAVARQMVEQVKDREPPGAIVNMSSVNAVFALPTQIPYSISKGGINQLTKGMAIALAPHGIRVNAIGPGSINTNMLGTVNSDLAARKRLLTRTPLGRIGEPSEVASIASFLASKDASYITGQTIYCDGGRLPLNYVMPAPEE